MDKKYNLKILFITDIHQSLNGIKKIDFSGYDAILCGGDILDPGHPDMHIARQIIEHLPESTYIVPGNCDRGTEIIDLFNQRMVNIHFKKTEIYDIPVIGIGYSRSLKDDLKIYRKYFQDNKKALLNFYQSSKQSFIIEYCGIRILKDGEVVFLDENETDKKQAGLLKRFESFEEDEVEKFINSIDLFNNGIILTHSPPYGVLDKLDGLPHIGSTSIKSGIESIKPVLVLCGHFHELAGTIENENTIYFNPGAVKDNRYGEIIIKDGKIETNMIAL